MDVAQRAPSGVWKRPTQGDIMETRVPTVVQAASSSYDLTRLMTPEDYRSSGRAHLFPSIVSLRWFMREYRHVLLEAGALSRIVGRLLIDPLPFDAVVAAIGRERAAQPA